MSGEWIKLRVNIGRDPRVVAMASSLFRRQPQQNGIAGAPSGDVAQPPPNPIMPGLDNVGVTESFKTRVALAMTIDGLLKVWGALHENGIAVESDVILEHSTFDALDRIAEIDGFGEAMAKVGWVRACSSGCVFPRFGVNNTVVKARTAKSSADRQRDYRGRKRGTGTAKRVTKNSATRTVTRYEEVTGSNGDKKRGEEKRIEESPPTPRKAGGRGVQAASIEQVLALCSDRGYRSPAFAAAMTDFHAERSRGGRPMSLRSVTAMLAKFDPVGEQRATAAIVDSVANGWQGVFPESRGAAGGRIDADERRAQKRQGEYGFDMDGAVTDLLANGKEQP
jgi:hypothetical protein